MQNNRWSGVSTLPYGAGWGTNPPGGVASCMTWDVTPVAPKWDSSPANYTRPRSVSGARYLLEPSMNYSERPMLQDISADYPINVYSTAQTPNDCDDHLRYGPRGPSRCGTHYGEDFEVSTPVCCCSGRNQPRTGRKCERCNSYRRYQDGCRQSPKPPVNKFVQFAPENTGRVVEIVEDGRGRPVTMAISQPTPSQMMRNRRSYGTQGQWTKTYPHTDVEMVDASRCEVGEYRNGVTNDVRRLMNIYQAGKADTNFHKGVSEKWRSAVVSAGPGGREEVVTETKEKEKTVAVRRRVRYPVKQTIADETDQQLYCRDGYEPRGILTRGNGMRVMERQPCAAHGWKDPTDGHVRAWDADESPQPPNRVKLQIECPANVDTVVNVRVRPDVDYRFN